MLLIFLILYLFADGFAFSQEEHGAVDQTEIVRNADSTRPKPSGR